MKTDRRDAEKLARCYRAGELTAVWVHGKQQRRISWRRGTGWASSCLGTAGGRKAWTKQHLEWISTHVHFDQPALEATLEDYLNEVKHVAERIVELEKAIDEAVQQAPPEIRAVIEACSHDRIGTRIAVAV